MGITIFLKLKMKVISTQTRIEQDAIERRAWINKVEFRNQVLANAAVAKASEGNVFIKFVSDYFVWISLSILTFICNFLLISSFEELVSLKLIACYCILNYICMNVFIIAINFPIAEVQRILK